MCRDYCVTVYINGYDIIVNTDILISTRVASG